jgi:peptidoglycan/LPS O-acetylase OafA/YrhL
MTAAEIMKTRIGYVDGLRAVAILSVVACHAVQYSTIDPHSKLAFIFQQGSHGVDLFFVISGFCLAHPTLDRLQRTGATTFDVARYAARRIVRIIPPYYATIALLAVLGIAFAHFGIPLPASMPPNGFTALDVLRQALFLDYGQLPHLLTRAFWTLQIEFRWYFLFPILLLIWVRSAKSFWLIALSTLILAFTDAGNSDLNFLTSFMLGIVAAQIEISKPRLAFLALPALFILFPIGVLYWPPQPGSHIWHVISFLFVVAAGCIPSLTRALSLRALTLVGLASYSIYLIHEPTTSLLAARGVSAPLTGLAALCAGFAFWWIVERPFVDSKLKDRLLADFDAFLPRWFEIAGVSKKIDLNAAPASDRARSSPEAVAALATDSEHALQSLGARTRS